MKIIITLFIFVITVVVSILVMIHGWGLTPQSWWWIIGGAFFQITMLIINAFIGSLPEK